MPSNIARPAVLLLSSTLLAIAAEPLPSATAISGMAANSGGSGYGRTVSYSTGDVNGDGYTDIALGGRIYWGSADGWKGDDYFEPEDPTRGQQQVLAVRGASNPYTTLWIVPNVSGQEGDGKSRADLIGVDAYGDGRILHVSPPPAQSVYPVLLNEAFPSVALTRIVGEPAIGDFNGDAILDIAWVSDNFGYSYVNLALGTDDSESFLVSSQGWINNHDYAAVAGLPNGNGTHDLLVVRSNGSESVADRYRSGISDLSDSSPDLTTNLGAHIFQPVLTVGDINGDELPDAAVTSPHDDVTVFVTTNSNSQSPPHVLSGSGVGWIIPDATGDGTDDVSWGDTGLTTGLIHGGDEFDADGSVPPIDRTVPLNQQENPEYRIGRPSGSVFNAFRLAAVSTVVADQFFSRQLLAIDFSGYQGNYFGFADTQVLPKLQPQFNGALLPIPPEGGPLVGSSFDVQFTGNGRFDGLVVLVYGYENGDSLSHGTLPSSVDSMFDSSDSETHVGNYVFYSESGVTEADLVTLLKGLRFTASAGGSTRSVELVILGRANAEPTSDLVYAGATLSTTAQVGAPGIDIAGLDTGTVGGSVPLSITGGVGPYRVSAIGGVVRVGGSVDGALKAFVTPTRGGTVHITVTDNQGHSSTHDITVTELARTTLPAPGLEISTGTATVFGPVCPGTTSGLASLRRALSGSDRRRTRGFAWDSASQSYTELPSEPDGGLTPNDGVFLASRVALGLDFSGPAVPTGATIMLRAEWNFVGLGPVDDGGTIATQHSLSSNFSVLDLSGNLASFADITQAYRWDGSGYVVTDTIESGIGYWIRNVASDGQPRLLQRDATSAGAQRARGAVQFARDAGAPPAPPSTDTKAESDGGSCGAGSGIGAMLGMLLAFLRLRSRQR